MQSTPTYTLSTPIKPDDPLKTTRNPLPATGNPVQATGNPLLVLNEGLAKRYRAH